MKKLILAAAFALSSALAWAGPVNINKADAKTIDKELVGVGPVKAEAIVKYRTDNGPFTAPEQIKKVEGIGKAIYEQNKANIKITD